MAIEDELYQDIILEHYRATENRRVLTGATHQQRGENPSCGDTLTLFMRADANTIHEVSYEGAGCAICCASANMLCALLPADWAGAAALYRRFHDFLVATDAPPALDERYDDLTALGGVRKFPLRIKCALLPWSALFVMVEERSKT